MRIRGRLMFDYIHCFVSDRGLDHVCIKQVIYCQRWHPKVLAFLCDRLSLDVGIEGGCFEPADCPGMEQVNVSIQNPSILQAVKKSRDFHRLHITYECLKENKN